MSKKRFYKRIAKLGIFNFVGVVAITFVPNVMSGFIPDCTMEPRTEEEKNYCESVFKEPNQNKSYTTQTPTPTTFLFPTKTESNNKGSVGASITPSQQRNPTTSTPTPKIITTQSPVPTSVQSTTTIP